MGGHQDGHIADAERDLPQDRAAAPPTGRSPVRPAWEPGGGAGRRRRDHHAVRFSTRRMTPIVPHRAKLTPRTNSARNHHGNAGITAPPLTCCWRPSPRSARRAQRRPGGGVLVPVHPQIDPGQAAALDGREFGARACRVLEPDRVRAATADIREVRCLASLAVGRRGMVLPGQPQGLEPADGRRRRLPIRPVVAKQRDA